MQCMSIQQESKQIKTNHVVPQKIQIGLSYDLTIPSMGMYPKRNESREFVHPYPWRHYL